MTHVHGPDSFRPRDEPVAVHPALRPFVDAARQQPIVEPRVSAFEVQRAWAQQQRERKQSRRSLGVGVTLGLIAAAVVAAIALPLLSSNEPALERGAAKVEHDASLEAGASPSETSVTDDLQIADGHDVAAGETWQLSPMIHLRSEPDAEPPQVLGPWSIALGEGKHEVEFEDGAEHPLQIQLAGLPGRHLELVHGTLRVEIVQGTPAVHLYNGVAAWIDEDGTRTEIQVQRIELDSPDAEREPTAAELAREVERKLSKGDRDAALAGLRQLIKKYPRSTQARTGLLDLALLERTSGNRDAARCAYQLFLERWPESSLRGEVETQLERLGEGRSCRGLDPR